MIVTQNDFATVIDRLSSTSFYGLDTETTGLSLTDRLFSIVLADSQGTYYFNFQQYKGLAPSWILPRDYIKRMASIFNNPESIFFMHNAKFDMRMLANEGIEIKGVVHCTNAMERIVRNNHFGGRAYSLDSCVARRGWQKSNAVDDFIKKHKLYTRVKIPGKEKLFELKKYDQVPWEVITPYGELDAKLVLDLGLAQLKELQTTDKSSPIHIPKSDQIVANERELTKACFTMETTGIHIDKEYTRRALSFMQTKAHLAKQDFKELTGVEFEDSSIVLKACFEAVGVKLPTTATGRPSTAKEVLDNLEHPIAAKIREIRGYEKLCSTYYSSFLFFADSDDLVHANMRQGGTETSRFSYSDPNLQNLPKEDDAEDLEKPYLVRRCFTPINEDFCFVPIDYEQQEFKVMLDYAGEKSMIDLVLSGMDVHEATGQLVGCTRKKAKTINFGLLYGMGVNKLAKALAIPIDEAIDLRNQYFRKLPRVKQFISNVMATGEARGYIWNWYGFRNYIASPEYAYILPNHLIQGSCAQIIRVAMVQIDKYIREHSLKSRMLVQVHDELLFQVHKSELHHVESFKKIMEAVYPPKNGLYLTCSVEHSWKSWAKADQIKGLPVGEEGRNTIQR